MYQSASRNAWHALHVRRYGFGLVALPPIPLSPRFLLVSLYQFPFPQLFIGINLGVDCHDC